MENRNGPIFFAITPGVLWLVAATAMFGCSDVSRARDNAGHPALIDRSDNAGALLKNHERGEKRALRVKTDMARNRLWVLGLQQVYVYDINAKQLIRRVALPAWSIAGIRCSPDLILDRTGSAYISSNAEPRLWKIDADNFSIKEHAIRLLGREGWETGFGALAFAADGTLFALTSFTGSMWRIELAKSSASEVELSERLANTCALNSPRENGKRTEQRAVTLCAGADGGSRRIAIFPDLNRGRVFKEACPS
jgi:hypothetical protein